MCLRSLQSTRQCHGRRARCPQTHRTSTVMGGYALPVRSVTKICRVRRVSIAVTSLSQRELRPRAAPRRAGAPCLAAPQRSRVHAHGRHRWGERRKRYGRGADEQRGSRTGTYARKQAKRHVMTCCGTPTAAYLDHLQATRCTPWPPGAATSLAILPRFCLTRGRRCAALARSARAPVATAESTKRCAAARRRR